MFGWTIAFLIAAMALAVLGFGGLAGAAVGVAQTLFFVFVMLFAVALLARIGKDGAPRP